MRIIREVIIITPFLLFGYAVVWYLLHAGYPLPEPIAPKIPTHPPVPEGILIHHSATPTRLKGRLVDAKKIDEMHHQRGFSIVCKDKVYHIGYHYVILPDGRIQPGRPENCPGAHSGVIYYNQRYLGVCLIGDFDSHGRWNGKRSPRQPTEPQIRALVKLCVKLIQKYRMPLENVRQHRDVSQTYCPGDYFPYRRVQELIVQKLKRHM